MSAFEWAVFASFMPALLSWWWLALRSIGRMP